MNLTIVNLEAILAAHENPDLLPDMIVRMTGFSALSKDFRHLVVDRIINAARTSLP